MQHNKSYNNTRVNDFECSLIQFEATIYAFSHS